MVLKEFQTNPYFAEFYEAIIKTLFIFQRSLLSASPIELFPDRQVACYVLAGQANLLIMLAPEETSNNHWNNWRSYIT